MTSNFRSCTSSFHGAAHNWLCQLRFHISLTEGVGMDDGEGNEQLFLASNALASVVCHATGYYRHLCIHVHFNKWDQDKYECLGKPALCTTYVTLLFICYWSRLLSEYSHSSHGTPKLHNQH